MDVNVSIWLAFLAGLASFLTPCVFSLVPAYIGYLSGRSVAAEQAIESPHRWDTFMHGLAFVAGFSIVFIFFGIAASFLGSLLVQARPWMARIGGVVMIVFGVHMTGIVRIPFLEYDLRPMTRGDVKRSLVSSLMLGVFFSAGWSPCIGPVLGAILTMATYGGAVLNGIKLLSAYSVGLAIPFLLAALGIGWVAKILRKYSKVMHWVEIGMGIVLILVGILMISGRLAQLSDYGYFIDFGL